VPSIDNEKLLKVIVLINSAREWCLYPPAIKRIMFAIVKGIHTAKVLFFIKSFIPFIRYDLVNPYPDKRRKIDTLNVAKKRNCGGRCSLSALIKWPIMTNVIAMPFS
jgi:hypothetical protein